MERLPTESLFKPGSLDPVGDETLDILLDHELVTNKNGAHVLRHSQIEHDTPLSQIAPLRTV